MIYPYTLVDERFGEAAAVLPAATRSPTPCCCSSAAFWVGTTERPEATEADAPAATTCCSIGADHARRPRLVLLVIGQLVFSRLENKIPERL